MRKYIGPCLCGALDCSVCGPLQGADPAREALLDELLQFGWMEKLSENDQDELLDWVSATIDAR